MKRSWKAVSLVLWLALVFARPGAADETDADETLSPYFLVENGDPEVDRLPLKETRADVRIAGVIADVVVTQVYRNEGTHPLNAKYVFPASTRAAVHGMTLQVGEHRIQAKIREKKMAQQEFDTARKEGKSAALLEQQRPNVFSMNVANVMPQDEIRVELHYSELLVPTEGTYEFVYPTVVGPRYAGQPEENQDDSWVKSPYLHHGEPPSYKLEIGTRIAAGMPLQELLCPSHKTFVDWENDSSARVTLDPEEANGGNRDYILRYRLQGEQVQTGLLLYPGKDENFFLLMVQPPQRVEVAQIPPREYIFVLDVSGSMHGFPLDTAKVLMRELIGGLRPTDSFNVILFSGDSRLLAPSSLPATEENVNQAIAEIERESGGGGTELGEALEQALALPGSDGVSRTTIVVTDGFISAEASVFEGIRKNLNRSNLFAFGIGSSVNRYLIEGIARAGQGEPFVAIDADEAKEVAKRFQEYVQSPALTDIAVHTEGFETYDIEPLSIPDLFADRPLVVFGKWRGQATGKIRVTGVGGEGDYENVFDAAEAESSEDNRVLRYLWARERVRRLSDDGSSTDLMDETRLAVTELGLNYELLTRYTSFIAVHDVVRNPDGSAKNVDQPLPLPQGVEDSAVAVPEPELPLLLMLILLLLGVTRVRRVWS
ncbi:MAG TPA: VIT and VWA domain-containing protein [Thermoanaerobaculia bacterium]|jgi:Ca-activated chloride channel family protein|nr:VIT and VWA domain-containing protein [Thermoanaerobaculia bacterium]